VAKSVREKESHAGEERSSATSLGHTVKAIVLAGVYDWGVSSLDAVVPRPLVPVANRPLVTYGLEWLLEGGVEEICICSNYGYHILHEHLSSHEVFSSKPLSTDRGSVSEFLDYYQDTMPRGPAGCAYDAWCGSECETTLVIDGTIIPQIDLGALLKTHYESEALMTVVVSGDHGQSDKGDYSFPMGILVFSSKTLDMIPDTGFCDFKEGLIPQLHSQGERILPYLNKVSSPRVTGVSSYLAVNEWVLETLYEDRSPVPEAIGAQRHYKATRSQGYSSNESWVHPSSVVDPSSRLVGPVLIGPGCSIDKGAMLIGPLCIGAFCTVKANVVMSRSVVWDRCTVSQNVVLDRCVVSSNTTVQEGLKAANTVLTARGNPRRWS